jgi:hypothetical protein
MAKAKIRNKNDEVKRRSEWGAVSESEKKNVLGGIYR